MISKCGPNIVFSSGGLHAPQFLKVGSMLYFLIWECLAIRSAQILLLNSREFCFLVFGSRVNFYAAILSYLLSLQQIHENCRFVNSMGEGVFFLEI